MNTSRTNPAPTEPEAPRTGRFFAYCIMVGFLVGIPIGCFIGFSNPIV